MGMIYYNKINSWRYFNIFQNLFKRTLCNAPLYVQGQSPEKNIREYFYYIDHQGMLFLDDSKMKNFTSCFKDKQFLVFFFKRIRPNETKRYVKEFPFISLCGRERNYIRCDDVPLVYSHVIEKDGNDMFCYGNAGDLMFNRFEPEKIFMNPDTGRVYHPCDARFGSIGLVKSKLAIEFSKLFTFENGENNPPTKFKWKNKIYDLDTAWFMNILKEVKRA
ncbi:hypothetical protein O3M35_005342 [Rhynocoris fuscipes]|uniref:Uncharacterized protein n=1 Tax=Rhynocoris fuscipes TaxID=488301 RepID=A0AAW1DIU0_9HEMI